MKLLINQIREQALSLSPSERASIAHDLILSLEEPSHLLLSNEQEEEISQRVKKVQEGHMKGPLASEVFAEIEAQFK